MTFDYMIKVDHEVLHRNGFESMDIRLGRKTEVCDESAAIARLTNSAIAVPESIPLRPNCVWSKMHPRCFHFLSGLVALVTSEAVGARLSKAIDSDQRIVLNCETTCLKPMRIHTMVYTN